jgi:hypothetical protein
MPTEDLVPLRVQKRDDLILKVIIDFKERNYKPAWQDNEYYFEILLTTLGVPRSKRTFVLQI